MRRAALAAPFLALALGACRALPVPEPRLLDASDPRPEALLRAWVEETRDRRSLRGIARLAVDSAEGGVSLRSRQVLVLERPDRLRVEILGFLSQTAAVLVTDGGRYQLWNLQDGSFAEGSVTPTLLWEIAYLALTPAEAAELLLGAVVPEDATPLRSAELADGAIRVELAAAGRPVHRRLVFDAGGLLREVEQRRPGGSLVWEARYDGYASVGGAPLAHVLSVDIALGGAHAEIELSQVELNPELPPDMFRLPLPVAAGVGGVEGG